MIWFAWKLQYIIIGIDLVQSYNHFQSFIKSSTWFTVQWTGTLISISKLRVQIFRSTSNWIRKFKILQEIKVAWTTFLKNLRMQSQSFQNLCSCFHAVHANKAHDEIKRKKDIQWCFMWNSLSNTYTLYGKSVVRTCMTCLVSSVEPINFQEEILEVVDLLGFTQS